MFQAASTDTPPAMLPAASISVVGFSGTVRWPLRGIGLTVPELSCSKAAVAKFDLRTFILWLRSLSTVHFSFAKGVPIRKHYHSYPIVQFYGNILVVLHTFAGLGMRRIGAVAFCNPFANCLHSFLQHGSADDRR